MPSRAHLGFCLALSVGLFGCIPLADGDSCRAASDCAADELCSDIKQCARPEQAPGWRVSWTINGNAPGTAGACDLVFDMSLTISSSTEQQSFFPLACELGTFGFRALPVEYNTARVEARDSDERALGRGRASGPRDEGSQLTLDIVL